MENAWQILQALSPEELDQLQSHLKIEQTRRKADDSIRSEQFKLMEMQQKGATEANQSANQQLAGGSAPASPWQGMATSQDVLNMNQSFTG